MELLIRTKIYKGDYNNPKMGRFVLRTKLLSLETIPMAWKPSALTAGSPLNVVQNNIPKILVIFAVKTVINSRLYQKALIKNIYEVFHEDS